ncbi:unnamed protein product [Mytilus coruscus]|uniref:Uncharacterized protein n=1 Tax=Mytilus coruscus TaxID=42192 RepID=A0A6J8CX32_MYTCO|nr:unnamed protein product [Mytilus coruscus]
MIVEFKPKSRPGVWLKKCKPYFNQDCYLKRKAYRKCKKLHWRLKRAETKKNLIVSSRKYKRTLNKQFREYQKSVIDKFKNLRKSDSKAYWSHLNKCDTKGNKAVNKFAMDVLYDYFKNINALDEDDENYIVLPNNITDYNIELNQDITEDELSKRGFCHSKWLLEIKNTLYECGFNLMWDDQIIAKSDNISKNVKKCLSDRFMLNWSNIVMNSAKCLNYRIYKFDFLF